MDIGEFLEMIWAVIIVVASIAISSAKKKAKERQRHFQPMTVSAAPQAPAPQPAAPKAAAPAPAEMLPPLLKAEPVKPATMQPTIHAHAAALDCKTHDAPGSLGMASMEGRDLCHEEQMNDLVRSSFAPVTEKPGLTLDWSGENMVKAFIMQEVLTRPCDRRRIQG